MRYLDHSYQCRVEGTESIPNSLDRKYKESWAAFFGYFYLLLRNINANIFILLTLWYILLILLFTWHRAGRFDSKVFIFMVYFISFYTPITLSFLSF